MSALLVCFRRLGNIKSEVHHGTIRAALARKNSRELNMIALNQQHGIGEKRIDQRRVPHQLPALFGFFLESLEFLSREGQTVIEAERLEIRYIAVQYVPERISVQEADVIALVKGIHDKLPVHGFRDDPLVIESP